jgi:D-arabinose 1-dehydrogenase-like Zn-dependent alcohol dehydrogenase
MMVPTGLLLPHRSIVALVGGNLEETIRFSMHAGVRPMVETFPLERAAEAYESMMSAKVRFRAVLTMDA